MGFKIIPEDEIERDYERMIEQGQVTPHTLFSLANIYVNKRKKLKQAEELLERAVKQEPKNDMYLYTLGCARFYQGDYKKAIEAFNKAASLKANDYHSMNFIGRCKFHLGKKDEGIRIVESVTKIDPGFVYAWRALGMMYHSVKRQRDAEIAYLRAVALEPEDEETFATLKEIVEVSGREVQKSYADGEGMLFINKRTKDGKAVNEMVMTIPKKQPIQPTPWELQSVSSFGKTTYSKAKTRDAPSGNMVKCPVCGAKFVPTAGMIKPGGKIRCGKCTSLFKEPL